MMKVYMFTWKNKTNSNSKSHPTFTYIIITIINIIAIAEINYYNNNY